MGQHEIPSQLIETPVASLPATGYVRLKAIISDPKAKPPRLGPIPVSKTHWWRLVKLKLWPQPIKLSPNITVWKAEHIHELIKDIENESEEIQA